jgi:hypothetical protein
MKILSGACGRLRGMTYLIHRTRYEGPLGERVRHVPGATVPGRFGTPYASAEPGRG